MLILTNTIIYIYIYIYTDTYICFNILVASINIIGIRIGFHSIINKSYITVYIYIYGVTIIVIIIIIMGAAPSNNPQRHFRPEGRAQQRQHRWEKKGTRHNGGEGAQERDWISSRRWMSRTQSGTRSPAGPRQEENRKAEAANMSAKKPKAEAEA